MSSHTGSSTRVFVSSGERKARRMSFLQAQQKCFEEEEGEQEDCISRRLKEENDSRVDAILEAEVRRRQSKQDQEEPLAVKTMDQRMNALQRLHSMEWKRNQQDHIKIVREEVVRYEEVRSQRASEEVFFEGTRQGKTKTRRKLRKEEIIHSLGEIAPKSGFVQERNADPVAPRKLPQPPPPPPGNVWLQKKGSELFGSLGLTPASAEEEDEALRKALVASMQSFYTEQKNTELAITRSMPSGERSIKETKSEACWENVTSSVASVNQTIFVAKKGQVYSSLPSGEGYCQEKDEEPRKNFAHNFVSEKTDFVPRNSRMYLEPEPVAGKHYSAHSEFQSSGRTPGRERMVRANSRLDSPSPQHEEFNSSEYEWEKEEENYQDDDVPNHSSETQHITRATESVCSELVDSQTAGSDSLEITTPQFAYSPKESNDAKNAKEIRVTGRDNNVGQYQESAPTIRTNYSAPTADADVLPSFISTRPEPTKMDLTHSTCNADAKPPFGRTRTVSRSSDEKPVENCEKLEDKAVDPSCFMMFAPVKSSGTTSDKSETSPATALPPLADGSVTASGVPTPQPVTELHHSPTLYQEQFATSLSDLTHTLSSLKLQMQAYPTPSIPRHHQPYAYVPGAPPGVSTELLNPEAYLALLGMCGPAWQQTHGQSPFQAGPMTLDPRMQAAQLGMYNCNTPGMSLGSSGPTGMSLVHNAVDSSVPQAVPQQFPPPGMFVQPPMYSVPCPGMQPLHGGADPHLFQDATHQQLLVRQAALSHLSHPRHSGVSTMPYVDPQLANPHTMVDQNITRTTPITSVSPQEPLTSFLYTNGLPFTSSNGSLMEASKAAPPGMEAFMRQRASTTYPQAQPFLNHPLGMNGIGDHPPFVFGMQQPHMLNPAPVPFQPPSEPDVGRGRGRLRH